jgi:hypothetical protein
LHPTVRGLHKCIAELVDILIHSERGHRFIQRLLKHHIESSVESLAGGRATAEVRQRAANNDRVTSKV